MTFKIIKDLLPTPLATELQHMFLSDDPPWNYAMKTASDFDECGHGYFCIKPFSFGASGVEEEMLNFHPNIFSRITPMLKGLGLGYIRLIKVNMYPRTEKVIQHGAHHDRTYHETDKKYPWLQDNNEKTLLYYLNDNDGYTEYFPHGKDSIKVPSVFNTALYTDENILHRSSTCTNSSVRLTMNINFR